MPMAEVGYHSEFIVGKGLFARRDALTMTLQGAYRVQCGFIPRLLIIGNGAQSVIFDRNEIELYWRRVNISCVSHLFARIGRRWCVRMIGGRHALARHAHAVVASIVRFLARRRRARKHCERACRQYDPFHLSTSFDFLCDSIPGVTKQCRAPAMPRARARKVA
jgi:hypothetical protein